jgi:GNAT superfamily N-acetyltransferase
MKDLILQHHHQVYKRIAQLCDAQMGVEQAFEWTFANNGNSYPNFIFNEQIEKIEMEALNRLTKDNTLPPFWLSPNKALEPLLKKAGFRKIQVWQAMGLYPQDLTKPQPIADIEWALVDNEATLAEWTEIVSISFNMTFREHYFYPLLEASDFELFIFKQGGQAIATTLNFYWNDRVGGHFVATLPDYRKKGIGQWIFYQSLKRAFEKGYKAGLCTAMPKGANAWQRIGFSVYDEYYLYWQVGRY